MNSATLRKIDLLIDAYLQKLKTLYDLLALKNMLYQKRILSFRFLKV